MKRNIFLSAFTAVATLFSATAQTQYGDAKTEVNHPDWASNAVIYEVNLRQGTPERTFKGFEKQLPRLKELGVDVLWLMPIHPISKLNRKGTLGSYYAVADYKAVNPEFGTMKDFKQLVKTAHDLGMKVIIDEVCNHSGCDNKWVKSHPEYYMKNDKGEMYGPYDWTDTYKFDYSNPGMRKAMLDALTFWVKDLDIDGFRCDVAGEVPTDFWDEARTELNKIKPVFMLAEATKPELTVKAFDVDYNWPMKDLFNRIANTQKSNDYAVAHNMNLAAADALDIDSLLTQQAKEYPADAFNMLMITNHDLNSWEGTEFERLGNGVHAFAVLTYTLPGIPMLYTGQEVGFNHAFEFFEHDANIPDFTENDYTIFYKKLNNLRHNNKALRSGLQGGEMKRYYTSDKNVYAFSREADGQKVVVIANLSSYPAGVNFNNAGETPDLSGMVNYFTGEAEALPTLLDAWQYKVYTTPIE
jgi:glycosidase